MRRFVISVLVLVGACCVSWAATSMRYYVRDKLTGSSVLCSADRCFVAVGVDRYGFHTSVFGSLLERAKVRLNVAPSKPKDRASTVTVFTVTSTSVDVKEAPYPYSDFEVMNDSLYSRLGGYQRSLWRWTGETFERASMDEEAALARGHAPIDFDDRNGWYKRFDPFHRGDRTEVSIHPGHHQAVLLFEYDRAATYTLTLIDGQSRKVLISVDESPRSVDASSYASTVRSAAGGGRSL